MDRVRRSVLALAAIGAAALGLGLVLAWFLGGLAVASATTPRGDGETGRAGRTRRAGRGNGGDGAARGDDRLQRHDGAHQHRPRRPARVRLERVPSAENTAHRATAAARVGGREGRQSRLERELAAAEQEVDRLARLLNTLLMLAREGQAPVTGRLVSLGLASKHAHERWEGRSKQLGQRLRLEPGEDVVVHAVAEDLAIMLDNLIENALHYSPTGSAVAIEFGRDGADAYLAVLDDGPGLTLGRSKPSSSASTAGARARTPRARGLGSRSSRRLRGAGAAGRAWSQGRKVEPGPRSGFRPAMLSLRPNPPLEEPLGARS